MASYSKAELEQNRKSVATVALVGAVLVLIAFVSAGFSIASLLVGSDVLLVLIASLWWLFASKRASNLDGTWVDGWNGRDDWFVRYDLPFVSGRTKSEPSDHGTPE